MHTNASRLVVVLPLIVVTAIGIAGCSSKNKEAPGPAVAEINGAINSGTFDTTATLDCAQGKSLNVGGSGNTLTVTGTCAAVNIGGDKNKVTFQTVDKELVVVGENNTVTYHQGDPQIQNLGAGNTIAKS
jgi:hypothetical protein